MDQYSGGGGCSSYIKEDIRAKLLKIHRDRRENCNARDNQKRTRTGMKAEREATIQRINVREKNKEEIRRENENYYNIYR